MKLAYLILAHAQPRHLGRLIRSLQDDDARFFVHVDRKWDSAPFERILASERNVLLLPRRIKVFWGGFSQVMAVLTLLAAARETGIPFSYYCLLSDSDFPIKSKEQIKTAFQSGKEFISIDEPVDAAAPRLRRSLSKHHFYDLNLLNPRAGRTRSGRLLRQGLVRLNNTINEYLPDRAFPVAATPCRGSQWWCLTGACIEHIFRFHEENESYERFFRFTRAPDEIFFHTIVHASPFMDRVVHHFARSSLNSNDRGSHYIDWSSDCASPKVLLEDDLEALLASSCLFARKFSEARSARLLTMLERQMREK